MAIKIARERQINAGYQLLTKYVDNLGSRESQSSVIELHRKAYRIADALSLSFDIISQVVTKGKRAGN